MSATVPRHGTPSRRDAPRSSGLGRACLLAACAVLAGGACGGGSGPADGAEVPARRGTSLVVGTSLDRRALLVVPRDGGRATLRALGSPGDSLWSGGTDLPATADARALGGDAVLLGEDGTVRRYVPDRGILTELGRLGAGAAWTSAAGRGVYAAGDAAVEVGADGSWSYEFPRPVRWAAPVAGGDLAALLQPGDGPALRLYGRGAAESAGASDASLAPPALVTAWGTRLAFRTDGDAVVLLTVPQLIEAGRWPLPGAPAALAASPSTHRVYAALEGTGRVVAVDRFSGAVEELAELEEPVIALRPAVFGAGLLAATESGVWHLGLDGERARPVPTEWRADLPLGLPGDRVLVVEGGRVGVWAPGGAGVTPLEAPGDAWWIPVEWRPERPPAVAAARRADDAAAEPGGDAEESAGEPAPEGAGELGTDAGPEEEAEAVAPDAPDAPEGEATAAGYYAIVASSQSMSGIDALVENLSDAGYPASVQRHRDEAAELWYRVLVGPYGDRARAEEAARRLRRERGLEAWISEVGPDARPVDEGRPDA